jgi:hypothetical protein
MMSNLRLSTKTRALRASGLLALLATVILLACSSGVEDGLPSGKAGSSAGGTAAGGAAGSASTGGAIPTGGVVGVAGSAGSAGNVTSTGGTGGLGGGGQATGGGGSMAGGPSGGSGGAGGAGVGRSSGCGKTSTLTFGAAPNGTGAGGTQKIGNRNFIVRLPDNYDKEKPYWLIFGFHWRGGSGNDVDSGGTNQYNMAHYGLQKLSKNGAIFVAPDGNGGGWGSGDEDLKFVDDMVKLIQDNYCVDTKRLYANGFSYGGGMSYALACDRADVFRAVAIYNGAVLSGCKDGTKPIAYWQMHGLTDGTLGIGPARSMRDKFVQNNGCTAQTPPEPPQPPPYLANGGHICTNYSGCSSGHPLRWCAHQSGHGNAVVDGTDSLWHTCANPGMTCSDTCRCSWVPEDVWAFFNSL